MDYYIDADFTHYNPRRLDKTIESDFILRREIFQIEQEESDYKCKYDNCFKNLYTILFRRNNV